MSVNKQYKTTKNVLFYVICTFLMFFYIYRCNLSFLGIPDQLHSLRLSAVAFVIYAIIKSLVVFGTSFKKINGQTVATRSYRSYCFLCFILFAYGYLLNLAIGVKEGNSFYDTMLNIVLFTLPVIWALTIIFDTTEEFMRVLLFVGIAQSFFIILCFIDKSFASYVDLTLNYSENEYFDSHRSGYAGGIGCITAPGVIRYSTGILACVYMYLKKHRSTYLFIFTIFAILSSMIARTGLLIDFVALLFIVRSNKNINQGVFFIVTSCIIVFILYYLVSSGKYNMFLSERYARFTILEEEGIEEGFFANYFYGEDMVIPPLKWETIGGIGMISGKSANGYSVNVDGGPLRIYASIGIVFCIFVYFFLIKELIKNSRKSKIEWNRQTLWLYFCLLLISDFKEITFFVVYPMAIFYSLSILIYKEEKQFIRQ